MPSVELEGVCMGWGCVFFQVFYWHVTHRDRVELLIEHSGCSSAEVLVMGGLKKKKSATARFSALEPSTSRLAMLKPEAEKHRV